LASALICGPIVRRTSPTSASLWVELDDDYVVHARARPVRGPGPATRLTPAQKKEIVYSDAQFTVKVGGRFYALLTLDGLKPGWLYGYAILFVLLEGRRNLALSHFRGAAGGWSAAELEPLAMGGTIPMFRTFPIAKSEDIRIAFGSCRVLGGGFFGGPAVKGEDVFSLYGEHLRATAKDREASWPHLLLLLGDQIYADNVDRTVAAARLKEKGRGNKVLGTLNAPESILEWERDRLPGETKNLFRLRVLGKNVNLGKVDVPDYAGWGSFQCLAFEDFAALYVAAWTEPHAARLLANLPTFTTFDDHEIANDWNLTGGWVEQMKRAPGWVKAVTEGLAAYWMYQGWGNPFPLGKSDDRWRILERAARDGTDALEKLQKWFANRMRGSGRANFFYEIDIWPPILMLDTRNDRSFVAPKERGPNKVTVHADAADDILSDEQWRWLRDRMDQSGPLILAMSVPWLQLPCADVWLLRGTRPEISFIKDLEEQSQEMADIFEYYRRDIGTDQWTAFPKSFVKLTRELFNRGPFVFLSGDVHYSYGMLGRSSFPDLCKMGAAPLILHAVSSPLRSQWSDEELKKNDPEFCLSFISDGTAADMRRSFEQQVQASKTCDLSHDPSDVMRLFFPDALPVFERDKKKMKWTHLNNIGVVQLWKDGKTAKVTWLGASAKKGEALRELGSIESKPGKFVR
jgi:hypothetical protein